MALGAARGPARALARRPSGCRSRRPWPTASAAAISCFGSQLEPRAHGAGPVLPPGFVTHFTRDYEVAAPGGAPMIVEPAYFDRMYAASADPWGFTSRWYEKRKYAVTLAMLPREHYQDAFEPGCSIGVMTEQLAPRCCRLLSCDVSEAAVQAAAARNLGPARRPRGAAGPAPRLAARRFRPDRFLRVPVLLRRR